MTDKRIVLTTAGSEEEAKKIARALVKARLAACVNIIPQLTSVYRWKDAVEETSEFLLIIKTTASASSQVQKTISEVHSYEVPECICFNIEGGSSKYLQWIEDSVRGLESDE
jgi:periplasmic divalent cation tolerance protein